MVPWGDLLKIFSLFQCDQIARSFFNIWSFTSMKICPKVNKICKVGSKFCQILNKPSKKWPKLWRFGQTFAKSGHAASLFTSPPFPGPKIFRSSSRRRSASASPSAVRRSASPFGLARLPDPRARAGICREELKQNLFFFVKDGNELNKRPGIAFI